MASMLSLLPRRLAVAAAVAACVPPCPSAPVAPQSQSHFRCHVTATDAIDHLAASGQNADVTHFTCSVSGGPLDGFVAVGTNIWEPGTRRRKLVGSVVVARKGDSRVVYELKQGSKRITLDAGAAPGTAWEGEGTGTYRLATGEAAPLEGRSFRGIARSSGPDAFTIDVRLTGQ